MGMVMDGLLLSRAMPSTCLPVGAAFEDWQGRCCKCACGLTSETTVRSAGAVRVTCEEHMQGGRQTSLLSSCLPAGGVWRTDMNDVGASVVEALRSRPLPETA